MFECLLKIGRFCSYFDVLSVNLRVRYRWATELFGTRKLGLVKAEIQLQLKWSARFGKLFHRGIYIASTEIMRMFFFVWKPCRKHKRDSLPHTSLQSKVARVSECWCLKQILVLILPTLAGLKLHAGPIIFSTFILSLVLKSKRLFARRV